MSRGGPGRTGDGFWMTVRCHRMLPRDPSPVSRCYDLLRSIVRPLSIIAVSYLPKSVC